MNVPACIPLNEELLVCVSQPVAAYSRVYVNIRLQVISIPGACFTSSLPCVLDIHVGVMRACIFVCVSGSW